MQFPSVLQKDSGAPMNREIFYAAMNGDGTLDYEKYLKTAELLNCQSPFAELCNADELQFQVVHQVEELWMKLIACTLLDIDDYLQAENTNRVITLFRRVHIAQKLMIEQLALLETMSPKEYQPIRTKLGNGSGQESPGFRILLRMFQPIWNSFEEHYLKFRFEHMQLIHRTIGFGAKSLKGRPVEILEEGMRQKFFPELWEIRGQMTDAWGAEYGVKRDSLGGHH
jgi:tryptophan 2,3-dioxygenase